MDKTIYLDNCATTPLDAAALEVMCRVMGECFGNPSSIHAEGRKAAKVLSDARETLAASINARPSEIIFTSSGTEANNLVVSSIAGKCSRMGPTHIVTSTAEHASVHARLGCELRQNPGVVDVTTVGVAPRGRIQLDELRGAVRSDTRLLTILYCNNETGVLQDLDALLAVRKAHPGLLLHLDMVQSYMKIPVDVRAMPVDFITVSAHKIYGPKGAGFVFAREGNEVEPLLVGGAQESFRRAGTENVAAAAGFAEAVRRMPPARELRSRYKQLEDVFLSTLRTAGCQFQINGPMEESQRMPGILNLSFAGVRNKEDLLVGCDLNGVQVSSTSACHSGVIQESHVLKAMGVAPEAIAGSIRVCFNKFHSEDDIRDAARRIARVALRTAGHL